MFQRTSGVLIFSSFNVSGTYFTILNSRDIIVRNSRNFVWSIRDFIQYSKSFVQSFTNFIWSSKELPPEFQTSLRFSWTSSGIPLTLFRFPGISYGNLSKVSEALRTIPENSIECQELPLEFQEHRSDIQNFCPQY